jgi:TFIIF-interacting CTD phosphatase-like protein
LFETTIAFNANITFQKNIQPITAYDFIVDIEIEGTHHRVYVSKRPHVDEFLREVGRLFEVVIFTASLSKVQDSNNSYIIHVLL